MKPKDFSKKNFKLIPGADYEEGPISKYGTFGNMLRQRAVAGLKKSADAMPMDLNKLKGENIEQITDFINPVRGMYVAAKSFGPGFGAKTFSDMVTRKPMEWIDDKGAKLRSNGEYATYMRDKYYPKELDDLLVTDRKAYENRWGELVDKDQSRRNEIYEMPLRDIDKHKDELGTIDERLGLMLDEPGTMAGYVGTGPRTYEEALDHPELFKSQPGLKNKPFSREDMNALGSFNPETKEIRLNTWAGETAEEETGVMLHEIQHSIQNAEGWPRGGNTEEFKRRYDHQKRRLNKIIANYEIAEMLGEGYNKTGHKKAIEMFDKMPSTEQLYKNLYGEQMSRAVQEHFLSSEVLSPHNAKFNQRNLAKREALAERWDHYNRKLEKLRPSSAEYNNVKAYADKLQEEFMSLRKKTFVEGTPWRRLQEREGALQKPLIKLQNDGPIIGKTK